MRKSGRLLIINYVKTKCLTLLLILNAFSCQKSTLSKRYYLVDDVSVVGSKPTIEKIISINNQYEFNRLKDNVNYLVAPTRRGYKIIIESDAEITSETAHDVYSRINDQINQ